jgi:hypothetical protein
VRNVRAILIDPVAHTIGLVNHDASNYRNIYALLSDPPNGLNVDCFTAVNVDGRNTLWVDDEGLLKDPRYFFLWRGYAQPLAGRGLITGVNREGETVATTLKVSWVEARVTYHELSVKDMHTTEGHTDHPIYGKVWTMSIVPEFGPPKPRPKKPS